MQQQLIKSISKLFALGFLIFGLSQPALAWAPSFTGQVTTDTGAPVPAATVTQTTKPIKYDNCTGHWDENNYCVDGNEYTTYVPNTRSTGTDINGNYSFPSKDGFGCQENDHTFSASLPSGISGSCNAPTVGVNNGGGNYNMNISCTITPCDITYYSNKSHACYYDLNTTAFTGFQQDDSYVTSGPTPTGIRYQWINRDFVGGEIGNSKRGDNVQGIWRAKMHFDDGYYTFHVRSDDGVMMNVPGAEVCDGAPGHCAPGTPAGPDGRVIPRSYWYDHPASIPYDSPQKIHIADGDYNVIMAYYEAGGGASVNVWWDYEGVRACGSDYYEDWVPSIACGTQTRKFHNLPDAPDANNNCPETITTETRTLNCPAGYFCTAGVCVNNPVNGGWGNWSACSQACGGGTQTRNCNNPSPLYGGAECTRTDGSRTSPSNRVESRACNTQGCPVNAVCSPTHFNCVSGTPNSPNSSDPNNWTWNCSGLNGGTNAACSELRPINGGWTGFTACSAVCGGGIQTRTCTNPSPANGGTECQRANGTYTDPNNRSDSIACNTQACVSPWIQTSGGDVHSNTNINTQGSP